MDGGFGGCIKHYFAGCSWLISSNCCNLVEELDIILFVAILRHNLSLTGLFSSSFAIDAKEAKNLVRL